MWAGAAAAGPRVAFTFNDLPAHAPLPPGVTRVQVASRIIAALKQAGVAHVYGFVNGVQLEREPASAPVLALWRAAGFPLSDHTWSHLDLDAVGLPAWEADVARDAPLLRSYMPAEDWRWLRFPILAEGRDTAARAGARAFLAARGFRIAPVTLSFDDYAFNAPFARCAAMADAASVKRMERAYLAAAVAEACW